MTLLNSAAAAAETVVINEIHFHAERKKPTEFVELHNPGAEPVDITGWSLEKLKFPQRTVIPAGGFLVFASHPKAFQDEFGFAPAGQLPGQLKFNGEKISLRNDQGKTIDEVRYESGFPWPTATAGFGSSLERIHPKLPGSDPGSWRASGFVASLPITAVGPQKQATVLVPPASDKWRFLKGTKEASQPREAWRALNFPDARIWPTGKAAFGYGDDDDATILTDMQGKYSCVFLRHLFTFPAVKPDAGKQPPPAGLLLRVRVDDGCIIWLNGSELARLHVPEGDLAFNAFAQEHEADPTAFEELYIPNAEKFLKTGENVLAVQAWNVSLESSDFTIDVELRTADGPPVGLVNQRAPDSRRPTPGRSNSCFAENAPPTIQLVQHRPQQPKVGEPVIVTAKVSDADGIERVALQIQAVAPGSYVRKTDPAYESQWTVLAMVDDGTNGDKTAKDGIFTATVPAEYQKHRWLNRYRIVAVDRRGLGARAPYPDDTVLNFAWFCYSGFPAWTGASQPGKTKPHIYAKEFFQTLQAYHLLAVAEDVARSQWDGNFHKQPAWGTLVIGNEVYDHIQFHNRGAGSAHIAGKNKWGFKFARTHDVAVRNDRGELYREKWDSLNLNPGIYTPYTSVHRGISGLDEAVTFRAHQLAGVPSSATHWIQFRVIDALEEASKTSQYEGDLWGLYLAIADMDGSFLKEQKLDDGLIVSMQSGVKHTARGDTNPQATWDKFINTARSRPQETWWRENLDLPAYYSFHAINRLLANVDIRPDGNHGYYRKPDGHWEPIPWDNDMMFVPRHHQPGHIDAIYCLDHPAIKLEYQGRAREILDLFAADPSPTGGQIGQLVSDLGRVLLPSKQLNTWPQLDADLWNHHPRMNEKGAYFRNPADAGHFGGNWTRTLSTPDFAGFQKYIVTFCTDSRKEKNYAPNDGNPVGYGWGYLDFEARDDQIPKRPTIEEVRGPATGEKTFKASVYLSPTKQRGKAIEWRVGRILTAGINGWKSNEPCRYELEEHWRSSPNGQDPLSLPTTITIPAKVFAEPGQYRVRARYHDQSGRVSHWSAPIPVNSISPITSPGK